MTELEKVAQEVEEQLFSELYTPALVNKYNEIAENQGLSKIASEQDLQNALNIIKFIEDNGASSVEDNDSNNNDLSKAASVFYQNTENDELEKVAFAGASDDKLVNNIKKLLSVKKN